MADSEQDKLRKSIEERMQNPAWISPDADDSDEDNDLHEHKKFKVDPGQNSMRIDRWLPHHMPKVSRSKIKKAAENDCLVVNGKPVKASYKIKPGDEVSVRLPYPPPPDIVPENIPVDVHYEDEHLMLVNKPAGMVVHPGIGNWTGTLVQALLYYLNGNADTTNRKEVVWPGLVHRIDKDTSGLLLIAKTEDALFNLSNQFYHHKSDREYQAVVWGDVRDDSGTIRAPIGRHPKDRRKFQATDDQETGKASVTHYEVLERFGICTYVKCKLETGRTHQIRVHMQYLGHTLFGDTFYGGDKILAGNRHKKEYFMFIKKCLQTMRRQALHAKTLGFIHPSTGKKVTFDSELPDDFRELLELMRNRIQN